MGCTSWAARTLLLALALGLAGASSRAATFTDATLAAIASNVGSAVFTTPDAPGLTLTVVETTTATLAGSMLFDYEGLWLGSDGTGGRYTLSFNQPISSISLSFIALSNLGVGLTETLNAFVSSSTSTPSFISSDGSASFVAGTLSPLEEDSRGVITFTAVSAAFNSLRFDHLQPAHLQGIVLERVDVQLAPVPEPGSVWMWAGGLLALLARWRLSGSARDEREHRDARDASHVHPAGGVL